MPTYQLVDKYNCAGVSCVNVYHYNSNTTDGEDALTEAFDLNVLNKIVLVQSEDVVHTCLTATVLEEGPAIPADRRDITNADGNVGYPALPANKVYVVSLYSATFTKHGRGRKYLAGIPDAWEDDNAIVAEEGLNEPPTLLYDVAYAMTQQITHVGTGAVFTPVVYSPAHGLTHDIIKAAHQAQVRTLRSRTAKRT